MNILYFSPIMWNDLKQRPQHIAEELAKENNIIYVEPSVSFINSIFNKNNFYNKNYQKLNSNFEIIRASGFFRLPKSFEFFDFLKVGVFIERLILKKYIKNSDVIWLGSPVFYPLIKNIKNKTIIYDKMDDYAGLIKNVFLKKYLIKAENKLINFVNIIFVSCNKFLNEIKHKNIFLIKNGISNSFNKLDFNSEISFFLKEQREKGNKIFGYIGTIDDWFDFDVINKILNFDKKFCVVIVGKNNLNKIENDRAFYFNPVSKKYLPNIIKSFDFSLYNFKKNSLLDTINPVKIYEYLSLNSKVISVKSMETIEYKNYLNLYDNYDELNNILNNLNSINSPFENNFLQEQFIINNSWESRVSEILKRINSYENINHNPKL